MTFATKPLKSTDAVLDDLKQRAMKRGGRHALFLWAGVAGVACLGRPHFLRMLVEAGLYLGLLAWPLRQELILGTLAALSQSQRIFLTLLVALMLFGQLHGESTDTYPFATWEMYTRQFARNQSYYDFSGVMTDGQEVPLRMTREFRIVREHLPFKLAILGEKILATTNEVRRAKRVGEYERTLRALGRKYNDDHLSAPIVAVRAWRHTFSLEDYQQTGGTNRKLFWELPLAPMKRADAL